MVVAPATADLLAKMAGGHADDLATTVLMATDKPVLVAPAMNPRMWLHPATRRNVAQLQADGIRFIGPNAARWRKRGEAGPGRLAEVPELVAAANGMPRGAAPMQPVARLVESPHSPAATCSSPAAPRTSRSIPCATSPTARPASRGTPSPPPRPAPALASRWCPGPVSLPDPAGVASRACRDRRADAGCRARKPAGRHRHLRRRRRRLARCGVGARRQDQEVRSARPPSLDLVENPTSWRTIGSRGAGRPGARHRLCRRDRRRRRATRARSANPRAPTGSSPTTCPRDRHHGRRPQHACTSSPPPASRTGRP